MSLLNRLERRLGRFAVPNLTLFLVVGQACLYIANLLPQGVSLDRVRLDPASVMEGQVWRLVTFLFAPPAIAPIFVLFYFMLLHLFGSSLEHHWGAFRYNVFLLIGYVANVAAAFAASAAAGSLAAGRPGEPALQFASMDASNAFLYSSVFLAFARLYPDFILNLFFMLPIRIKWLALLQWIGYGYLMVVGGGMTRMLVLATVLNYLMFFGPEHVREWRQSHRRRTFHAAAKKSTASPLHQCRICGLNSNDSPRTAFRYCSKCAGQVCYCPDHIRDHEHVADEEAMGGQTP